MGSKHARGVRALHCEAGERVAGAESKGGWPPMGDPMILLVVAGVFRLVGTVMAVRAERMRGRVAVALAQVPGPVSVVVAQDRVSCHRTGS
jgi:hypothetical protein